ncbi:hypothetical protein MUK42_11734 [Musa troglodytarum]|uniref:Secreted protein n=1 Tax=Musa troglodytarum TaxID=320322 RepID=A0A9E7KN29_9LILI|nr:hypothetical protein MUK42_11734 [Musa troglodytarum]
MDSGTDGSLRPRRLHCFVVIALLCSLSLIRPASGLSRGGGRRSLVVSLEDYSGPRANPRHQPKPKTIPKPKPKPKRRR